MIVPHLVRLLPLVLGLLRPSLAADPIEALRADGRPEAQGSPGDGKTPNLSATASTTFPNSEIFGVKLVNGLVTTAIVSVSNNEAAPISVRLIGGSLWTSETPGQESRVLRNLSTSTYQSEIPPGQSESFDYKISTDMHPQDMRLSIAAVVMDEQQRFFTLSAFNETVSVVEAPSSIFDPQILFLYLVLVGVFAGTGYWVYITWISTLFPQQKRRAGGKGGERTKTHSKSAKKVDAADQVGLAGEDGAAITSSAKVYDSAWIPEGHLKRPEAKRIRSGTPSGVKTKRVG